MFLSVKDLIGLPDMPGTAQGVRATLNKRVGNSATLKRKCAGSKAFEYHVDCLPSLARQAVQERYLNTVLTEQKSGFKSSLKAGKTAAKVSQELDLMRKCPVLLENKTAELTQLQRDIADARSALVAEVLALENAGLSRIRAIKYLCEQSHSGSLPEHLKKVADLANARKGKRTGISPRSLNGWVLDYLRAKDSAECLALLAPGYNKAKKPEQIAWLPDFLSFYRDPKGYVLAEAYVLFAESWRERFAGQDSALAALPSIHAVRREMNKLPVIVKERYRVTGSAWRSLNPFVRRDWSQIPVNGVWVGDGHNMKLDVIHPQTGRPFSPEITLIIDARTRYIVGWSLALSENTIAVADALRFGMTYHGKPERYYSDNGAGEKNKTLDADITGILPRLGIVHSTGIPGNPQGRGIIERLNKETPNKIAKQFDTYYGQGADPETVRIRKRAVRSAMNAQAQGQDLTRNQLAVLKSIPTWQQLLDAIALEVDRYNIHHEHSSLPKGASGKHYTPAAYRNLLIEQESQVINRLSEVELRDMFRPQVIRKVSRGEVQHLNNRYFASELASEHGNDVRISYDIHDPNSVIVRRMDGSYLCDAYWNGNMRDAFAVSPAEHNQRQRVKGMVKRAEDKIAAAKEELSPIFNNDVAPDFSLLIQPDPVAEERKYFMFQSEADEYEREMENKKASGD